MTKCTKCDGIIKWSDLKNAFVCPKHGKKWRRWD